MDTNRAIEAFSALAQPTRLRAFRLLIAHEPHGVQAGDAARLLDVPQATMSTHLAVLSRAGLVTFERQSRAVIYRAELDTIRDIAAFLVNDCCEGDLELCGSLIEAFIPRPRSRNVADRIYNVLFLCTGNSARSVFAEAILNHVAGDRFHAYSAGSHPKGQVHPMTLKVLADAGIATEGFRSKPWEEFATPDAPKMDFVFTVCDQAAGEACPIWPGQPMTAHWGIEDPAAVAGPEFKQKAAFEDAMRFMSNRIAAFVSLPLSSIDRMALSSKLRGIGAMDGSTRLAPQVA